MLFVAPSRRPRLPAIGSDPFVRSLRSSYPLSVSSVYEATLIKINADLPFPLSNLARKENARRS